ncbi:MAG: XdhC family protein [Anaerolineae bacterium]|nr:XdhC family protein [Anaerolineae bacterium]
MNTLLFDALKTAIENRQICALATVLSGSALGKKLLLLQDGTLLGDLGSSEINQTVQAHLLEQMKAQTPSQITIKLKETETPVFVDVFPPPPRLMIVGAVHIAIPLVTYAKPLGFYTIVIDPRKAFANRERFPHADELILEWPADAMARLGIDVSTFVTILSHDNKFDVPALQVALQSPARYIGILGSRKTHEGRLAELKEIGVDEKLFQRIHSPIGLDLGAVGAAEIALTIIAEILAVKRNKLIKTIGS